MKEKKPYKKLILKFVIPISFLAIFLSTIFLVYMVFSAYLPLDSRLTRRSLMIFGACLALVLLELILRIYERIFKGKNKTCDSKDKPKNEDNEDSDIKNIVVISICYGLIVVLTILALKFLTPVLGPSTTEKVTSYISLFLAFISFEINKSINKPNWNEMTAKQKFLTVVAPFILLLGFFHLAYEIIKTFI